MPKPNLPTALVSSALEPKPNVRIPLTSASVNGASFTKNIPGSLSKG